MLKRIFVACCRIMAFHCPFASLRMGLLRMSGVRIGRDTFINMNVHFVDNYRGGGAIELGERVAVAPGAMFVADSDPNNSRLNQFPRFYIRGKVIVKQDAWIGANAIILPNITIGRSAIVGAGAVATKSVDDYAIVVGTPARKVGDVRVERNNQ